MVPLTMCVDVIRRRSKNGEPQNVQQGISNLEGRGRTCAAPWTFGVRCSTFCGSLCRPVPRLADQPI